MAMCGIPECGVVPGEVLHACQKPYNMYKVVLMPYGGPLGGSFPCCPRNDLICALGKNGQKCKFCRGAVKTCIAGTAAAEIVKPGSMLTNRECKEMRRTRVKQGKMVHEQAKAKLQQYLDSPCASVVWSKAQGEDTEPSCEPDPSPPPQPSCPVYYLMSDPSAEQQPVPEWFLSCPDTTPTQPRTAPAPAPSYLFQYCDPSQRIQGTIGEPQHHHQHLNSWPPPYNPGVASPPPRHPPPRSHQLHVQGISSLSRRDIMSAGVGSGSGQTSEPSNCARVPLSPSHLTESLPTSVSPMTPDSDTARACPCPACTQPSKKKRGSLRRAPAQATTSHTTCCSSQMAELKSTISTLRQIVSDMRVISRGLEVSASQLQKTTADQCHQPSPPSTSTNGSKLPSPNPNYQLYCSAIEFVLPELPTLNHKKDP